MKYVRKCQPVDIEPYSPGLEDGFDDDGRAYIHTDLGPMYIHEDDCIITSDNGEKSACNREKVDRLYQRVE
jgi:hypothetical protein